MVFGAPGHAYVYFIYGMYECLNLVAEPDGTPGCVLLRALEPVAGIERMRERRPRARRLEDLASGPGRLTLAMGITRALNGVDVTRGRLWCARPPGAAHRNRRHHAHRHPPLRRSPAAVRSRAIRS